MAESLFQNVLPMGGNGRRRGWPGFCLRKRLWSGAAITVLPVAATNRLRAPPRTAPAASDLSGISRRQEWAGCPWRTCRDCWNCNILPPSAREWGAPSALQRSTQILSCPRDTQTGQRALCSSQPPPLYQVCYVLQDMNRLFFKSRASQMWQRAMFARHFTRRVQDAGVRTGDQAPADAALSQKKQRSVSSERRAGAGADKKIKFFCCRVALPQYFSFGLCAAFFLIADGMRF